MKSKNMKHFIYQIIVSGILSSTLASGVIHAANYDTLPKHRSTLVFMHVNSGEINSDFDGKKNAASLKLEQNLSTKALADISDSANELIEELKSLSPNAFDKLTLGSFEGDVKAHAQVKAMAIGHGLTDRLTALVIIPYYKAEVDVAFRQTAPDNKKEVANLITQEENSQKAQLISQITAQLPDITGETIQSLVVNHFGYRPVGKWQGSGLGDIELGFIYRLTDYKDKGMAVGAGIVLPTGKAKDPDILQDINFGDAQTDLYAEAMGGISILKERGNIDFKIRGTYQFAKDKTLRIPESQSLKIGRDKGNFREKLGNMIDTKIGFSYAPLNWFNFGVQYLYNKTFESSYSSPHLDANRILRHESDSELHSYRLGAEITTVSSYIKGLFPLPFSTGLNFEQRFAGKNTQKYSRVDFELRFYF